jgi:hypothetical protein
VERSWPASEASEDPGVPHVPRDERRRKVENELEGWRQARRREDVSEPGSEDASEAAEDAESHRVEFERLTQLSRDEQRATDRQPTEGQTDSN